MILICVSEIPVSMTKSMQETSAEFFYCAVKRTALQVLNTFVLVMPAHDCAITPFGILLSSDMEDRIVVKTENLL